MVETAMVLPILIVLLGILVDAGLAINAWLRVNTAARDATRFALDAGRNADIVSLVLDKLNGIPNNEIDIYRIDGQTTSSGDILTDPYWIPRKLYGSGAALPKLTSEEVEQSLRVPGNNEANNRIHFVIVEVDVNYTPLIAELIAPNLKLPMTSFAIMQTAED